MFSHGGDDESQMEQQQTTTTGEQQQPPQTPPAPAPPPPPATAVATPPDTNPNSAPKPPPQSTTITTTTTTPQPPRPTFNTRPWKQQAPPYSHFSLPSPPLPSSSSSTFSSSSISTLSPAAPRMAIGVPAPPQQSQIRQPVQGMGMTGALGTTASMRPGVFAANQLRPSQSSHRPQTSPSSQPPTSQNFQGHGMLRVSSLGSPGSPSPGSAQTPQTQNQPWLSSGSQGKPPLPTPTLRPPASTQSFQQRSQNPQLHQHNMPNALQQQSVGSSQHSLQSSASGQPLEHHTQQFPSSKIQQPVLHQQQITRGSGLGSPRPPLSITQSGGFHPGGSNKTATAATEESSNRIVSKRSIQELVNQIDPSEKLDPEVEDILVDIAEDFVESITTFGCSLAKHRKSTTLEAKDILLHLERNWNMTLPGFGGDEIKTYKKPFVSDIHRERLAAVKRSMLTNDAPTKNSGGSSGANTKGHLAKGPSSIIGSPPNPKIREAT